MSEIMLSALALLAGILLGAMFFGGLWWTVLKGVASPRPALWFLGSLLLRTGITLAGFYFVAGADWKRLLVCLLGFIIARLIITRLTAQTIALSPSSDGATNHSTDATISHPTKQPKDGCQVVGYKPASGQVAGYLPQAGERDAVSLREFHVNEADHAS